MSVRKSQRWGWAILALAVWAHAETAAPSEDFWLYLAEFSDPDGELFDPLDLADAENVVRGQSGTTQSKTELQKRSQEESQP